jgi:hypothetical protein
MLDIDGTGQSPSAIYTIRIVAAGWKQGRKVIRKPVASRIDGPLAHTSPSTARIFFAAR